LCGPLLPFGISPAEQLYYTPLRDRVNDCAKARHLELIAYFAQAGWPKPPTSPVMEGNRVKVVRDSKGQA
jgi:hypothetical protein